MLQIVTIRCQFLQKCLPACKEVRFEAAVSSEKFPSAELLDVIRNIPLMRLFIDDAQHSQFYVVVAVVVKKQTTDNSNKNKNNSNNNFGRISAYEETDIRNWDEFLDQMNEDSEKQLVGAYYFHIYEKSRKERFLKREAGQVAKE